MVVINNDLSIGAIAIDKIENIEKIEKIEEKNRKNRKIAYGRH